MRTSLTVRNLCVEFPISKPKGVFSGINGARIGRSHDSEDVVVKALQKVSFQADEGDRIALIGVNGAGKTTLLRALCGICPPASGEVHAHGGIGVVFQPGIGMSQERTGLENIWLGGLFQGLTRSKIRESIPDILEFCELGDFIHLPIKTYSAGMRVRLAFAVATAAAPGILLLDEVIGVGDKNFIHKATHRRVRFMEEARIMVLASHARAVIEQFCNRVLWLEGGRIIEDSREVKAILARYEKTSSATQA